MAVSQLLESFNAGEISPLLDARVGIEKYGSGCRILENFLTTPYGPNIRRPGLAMCDGTLIDDQPSRLIPFVFSETETYVVELSHMLVRIWAGSGQKLTYITQREWVTAHDYVPGDLVLDPDFPGQGVVAICLVAHTSGTFATDKAALKWIDTTNQDFASPWMDSEIRDVQFAQINDLMYLTHPLHAPQLLTRNVNAAGDIYFLFVETPWDWPAMLEENVTPATITPSGTTGGILLTHSDPGFFKESHIDAYFQIGYRRTTSSVIVDFTANHSSSTIKMLGGWTLNTYGTWAATLTVDRSYDNGATWEVIRSYISNSDRNVTTTGNEVTEALLRLTVSNRTVGVSANTAILEADESKSYGLVRITAVNVTGPATLGTVTKITVQNPGILIASGVHVEITGGGGTGTAATAAVDLFGRVTSVTITAPGSGYTTPPRVRFWRPGLGGKSYYTDAQVFATAAIGQDGAIVAAANVINDLYTSGTPTTYWSEGAWSKYQGFPNAISVHENRVLYAGTTRKPQSIWGSRLDDYQNFRAGILADDGLFFTIAGTRTSLIQWLMSKDGFLHVGRIGSEGRVAASDPNAALSPDDIGWVSTTSYGSKHLPAIILNDALLFVQGQGRKIRSLAQVANTEAFSGQDVTILSEHITRGGIVEFAAQNLPDSILWCIRSDGTLLGMTYDALSSVVAWHRHVTDGAFESVCVIPGAFGDDVWFVVRRTINGVVRRFVERFSPGWREVWEDEQKEAWWYLDCAVQVANEPAAKLVSGLDHLEGETVRVLSDGADGGEYIVTGGEITMETAGSLNLVGLPYTSTMRPMKLAMQLQDGTSRARKARIANINVHVLKSLGGEVSTDGVAWDAILFRSTDDNMDESPPTHSGVSNVVAPGNYTEDGGDLWVRQTSPMPLTVVAVTPVWTPTSN